MKERKKDIELSIVIPVYNSEDCLDNLVLALEKALKKISYECILVNDGSKDRSWACILRLAATRKNFIGINLRKNSGQDNALMAGLNCINGKYTVIMDDDLQHNPQDIPRLLSKVKEGFDICYANFETKKQAWWKNFGSWLNGKAAEILINKPANIYLSPYKIIDSNVVREVVRYTGPFPYVDGLLFQYTSNITQIDAEHKKRFAGKSNYDIVRSIRVFKRLLVNFSTIPLRISSICGIFFALASIILALHFIFDRYICGKIDPPGWTSIVVLILFIGGMIMMSLGIMGEYLGRIYLNINAYPQYSIRDYINHHDS